MIQSPEDLQALTYELSTSAWTLTALGVLLECGALDRLREARVVDELAAEVPGLTRGQLARCLEIATTAGVLTEDGERYRLAGAVLPFLDEPARSALEGEIRSHLMQPLAFLDAARAKRAEDGWRHRDRVLLQAQGDHSSGLARAFKSKLLSALDGFGSRLEQDGASFLDVGVGVGSLAIAMCREFPALRVVGLDVADVPLAIAEENLTRARLRDRIELRRCGIEELSDEAAFDLAWLPSFFIPGGSLAEGAERIRRSLRPGGWVILALISAGNDRQRAASRLVNELWGGPLLSPEEAEDVLIEAGFSGVRSLPGPGWRAGLLIGRRD